MSQHRLSLALVVEQIWFLFRIGSLLNPQPTCQNQCLISTIISKRVLLLEGNYKCTHFVVFSWYNSLFQGGSHKETYVIGQNPLRTAPTDHFLPDWGKVKLFTSCHSPAGDMEQFAQFTFTFSLYCNIIIICILF